MVYAYLILLVCVISSIYVYAFSGFRVTKLNVSGDNMHGLMCNKHAVLMSLFRNHNFFVNRVTLSF